MPIQTRPKLTKKQITDWCPTPRGLQTPGHHAQISPMDDENAASQGKVQENRILGDKLVETFKQFKQPNGRFVLQWRMFPNAADTSSYTCGCGCSCGCG